MRDLHCTFASPTSLIAVQAPPATTAEAAASATADQGFVADRGGTEQTSGEILLIEAYAAIWLVLFVMMWASMRRQRRLDERISELGADLERARTARGVDDGGG